MSPHLEKRSRRTTVGTVGAAVVLTLALGAGCGKGERAAPREAGSRPSRSIDTVPAPPPDVEPVALPADFPADFPLAPGATLIRAGTESDATGTAASAALVTTVRADDTLSWYARALADAGWQVTGRDSVSVHAIQGESYADLLVTAAEADRTVLEARIWKTAH